MIRRGGLNMTFRKYNSIENTYQTKEIEYWVNLYPEIIDTKFVLEEKIHGTNIQLFFGKNGEFHVGSRNRMLEKEQNHMGIRKALDGMPHFIAFAKLFARTKGVNLRFYGELFGGNIQKNVDYGIEKKIVFFNLEIDGIMLSQKDFYILLREYDMEEFLIKSGNRLLNFHEAISTSPDFISRYAVGLRSPEFRYAEGFVMKPFKRNFVNQNGDCFFLKKKNERFAEVTRLPKIKTNQTEKITNPLDSYINKNRMYSVFSRYGRITQKNEMNKYIKIITEDAIIDYDRDNEISFDEFIKSNSVENIGGKIAKMLLEEL